MAGRLAGSEALPATFTLTILDEDGGEQGDWMCKLEPGTSSYASECGEFRVSFDDDEGCWVYTGGVFADQYLSAPGGAGVLPRAGWVGVEGGPAEGYFGRLAVGAEDAQFVVEGDTAWLGGGAREGGEGGEGAAPAPRPPQAPPPGSCLEPAEAPCGNMCEMRQAACCVMMDKRPLALPGEGYESYVVSGRTKHTRAGRRAHTQRSPKLAPVACHRPARHLEACSPAARWLAAGSGTAHP